MAYRIAVASTDGIVVNQHFGHAERFHIIEIDENTYKYSGTREVERVCQGHYHHDSSFDKVIDVLSDVHAVVVAKIIGTMLPIAAKRIKLDPAVMASPFITTIVDSITLVIYFAIASRALNF